MTPPSPDRATLAAFIGIVVLGGFDGISITFSNDELPPFWGATVRFGLASVMAGVYVGAFAPSLSRPLPRLVRSAPARSAGTGASESSAAGGGEGPPSLASPNCP